MKEGKLIFVPTPVGNLGDMTLRGIESLKNADLILCEDTRESGKLLKYFDIDKPLLSYHKFNEKERTGEIIDRLYRGDTICLISDQGTPGISDPGEILMKEALDAGFSPEVLPGATAFVPAMVLSGFSTRSFLYYGFIPEKKSEKDRFFLMCKESPVPVVCYESVHRIQKTLEELAEALPERPVALAREISKKHEEVLRGTATEVYEIGKKRKLKGEFVLVIDQKQEETGFGDEEIKKLLRAEIDKGLKPSKAAKLVAKSYDLPRNRCYELSLELKE